MEILAPCRHTNDSICSWTDLSYDIKVRLRKVDAVYREIYHMKFYRKNVFILSSK